MGILVAGLRQQQVKTVEEAVHLLSFGEEFRVPRLFMQKYRVTDYNAHSSRSHTVYKVFIERTTLVGAPQKKHVYSCLVRKASPELRGFGRV
jgi:hypothetical protein